MSERDSNQEPDPTEALKHHDHCQTLKDNLQAMIEPTARIIYELLKSAETGLNIILEPISTRDRAARILTLGTAAAIVGNAVIKNNWRDAVGFAADISGNRAVLSDPELYRYYPFFREELLAETTQLQTDFGNLKKILALNGLDLLEGAITENSDWTKANCSAVQRESDNAAYDIKCVVSFDFGDLANIDQ